MNKVFYLEPDEEITKVINRIRQSEEDGVVLVVPRNSTLAQSVINLKLLQRSAIEHKKVIGLVSTDRITKNLAEQLKVKVFGKVAEAETAMLRSETLVSPSLSKDDSSLKVNTYRKYDLGKMNEDERLKTEDEGPESIDEEIGTSDDIKLSKKSLADEKVIYEPFDSTQDRPEAKIEDAEPGIEDEGRLKTKDEGLGSEDNRNKDDDMNLRSAHSTGSGQGKAGHIKTGGSRKPLLILLGSILVILAIVVGLFLPSAQATVTLKTADFEQKSSISVDQNQKGFDNTNNILQGTMVELEKSVSKSFNSTGKKDAGVKANGTITISNSVSSSQIPLSPGAKVTSSSGLVFTVNKGAMIPGMTNVQISGGKVTSFDAGTIDATVTSANNGESYNLAVDSKFTIQTSVGQLTATNKAAFTGGVTKNIAFVTDTDLSNAETAIAAQALSDNKAILLDNASKSNLKVFDKYINLSVISFSSDKKSNDEADTFVTTLDAKLSTLCFSESDLRGGMITLASSQLDNTTMLVNPENSELTYVVSDYSADTNILKLDVDFKAKTGAKISADMLAKNLKGKNATSAQNYLESQDGVAAVSVKYTPSFWRMMPFMINRIKVNFDYQK
ncbi:MAG: hypothetical protein Q7S80_00825 [bacterium]|nr:hypothetical protein [bacterium]